MKADLVDFMADLATIALNCKTPNDIDQKVVGDTKKRAMLEELRWRSGKCAAISPACSILLAVIQKRGTAFYTEKARVFQLLTGYSANWWKKHQLVVAKLDPGDDEDEAE